MVPPETEDMVPPETEDMRRALGLPAETDEVPTSDYHELLSAGREIFQVADKLDAVGTEPAKDLASCLGILLLAVQHGYVSECRESLTAFAETHHLHPSSL